jgi:hypothetical protein
MSPNITSGPLRRWATSVTGWSSPILQLPANPNTCVTTRFLLHTSLSQREQQLHWRRGGATPGLKEWPLSATSLPAPPATTTTTASRQPPPPSGSIASPSPSAPFAPAPAPSPVSNFSPALIVDLLSPLRPPLPAERESPIVLLQRQCARLIPLLAGVYAISSNDIRVGTNVEVDGAPWKVLGDKTAFLSLPSFIRRLFIHPRLLKDMQHCTSISFMDTTHLVFIEKQKLRRCAKCTSLLCKICRLTSLHPTTEFLHVKPGKGAAFVRTKLRNYVTGNTVEKTFRAGSTVNYSHLKPHHVF